MPLPPRLAAELDRLRGANMVEVIEEPDLINLILSDFQLGEGFNAARCELLVRIPRTYPDAGPDMFWTTPNVTLANGQIPQSAESIESYLGKTWRRFSWHRQAWNANVDDLLGYLEFIRRRLREKR